MPNFRDFDAMLTEKVSGRPSFKLGGQSFTCRAKLPWKKYSGMMLTLTSEDASRVDSLDRTEDFFRLCLIREDRERFIELLNRDGEDDEDEEGYAGNEQVGELLDWLMEYYTGKAMESGELSSDKQPSTGQPVKPASLSAVPTSA